jgi:hypothetical protein
MSAMRAASVIAPRGVDAMCQRQTLAKVAVEMAGGNTDSAHLRFVRRPAGRTTLLFPERYGSDHSSSGGKAENERKAAAPQPTMLWRSQTLGFDPRFETKGLNPGRRYSFAKTAVANKIMFTKAMNATVT